MSLQAPTGEELLGTYCISRSLLAASSGIPNYWSAARVILKDYTNGNLLFCHCPPYISSIDLDEKKWEQVFYQETLATSFKTWHKPPPQECRTPRSSAAPPGAPHPTPVHPTQPRRTPPNPGAPHPFPPHPTLGLSSTEAAMLSPLAKAAKAGITAWPVGSVSFAELELVA